MKQRRFSKELLLLEAESNFLQSVFHISLCSFFFLGEKSRTKPESFAKWHYGTHSALIDSSKTHYLPLVFAFPAGMHGSPACEPKQQGECCRRGNKPLDSFYYFAISFAHGSGSDLPIVLVSTMKKKNLCGQETLCRLRCNP